MSGWGRTDVKSAQVIDGANNAACSAFQATDEEFAASFPGGRDMATIEDLVGRLGDDGTAHVLTLLWGRPIRKRETHGPRGTLFHDNARRGRSASGREVDRDDGSIDPARRALFSRHRE